jgi:hypothetical protein
MVDLDRAAVADDPWFGWSEPNRRTVDEYWRGELLTLRWFGVLNEWRLAARMTGMPFLPRVIIERIYECIATAAEGDSWAAEAMRLCRNRSIVGYTARAWRERIVSQRDDCVVQTLRDALVNWDRRASDTLRCLLADEVGDVRMAAAELLAEIGELRDIGIFSDLLAMAELPDELPEERMVLADAMERLAMHIHDARRPLPD